MYPKRLQKVKFPKSTEQLGWILGAPSSPLGALFWSNSFVFSILKTPPEGSQWKTFGCSSTHSWEALSQARSQALREISVLLKLKPPDSGDVLRATTPLSSGTVSHNQSSSLRESLKDTECFSDILNFPTLRDQPLLSFSPLQDQCDLWSLTPLCGMDDKLGYPRLMT